MCELCIQFKELNRHYIGFYLYRYRQIPISEWKLKLELEIGIQNRDEIGNGVLLRRRSCQIYSRRDPLLCTQFNCMHNLSHFPVYSDTCTRRAGVLTGAVWGAYGRGGAAYGHGARGHNRTGRGRGRACAAS